jgi:hypothetical protein
VIEIWEEVDIVISVGHNRRENFHPIRLEREFKGMEMRCLD